MNRPLLRILFVLLVGICLGAATTAGVLAIIPDPGSPPAVFDDFGFSSTGNGFWHVNANGSTERIKNGILTLSGHSIELDHRLQTDPTTTEVSAKVRGISFKRFGIGIGIYHSGTIGMEFDDEGIKCGRGTDQGWKVDNVVSWKKPPVNKWFYLRVSVTNPYPDPKVQARLGDIDPSKLKPIVVLCTAWDDRGHLLKTVNARDPRPNGHYVALDEAFLRTWDSHNKYQVDWFYAGPPAGDPMRTLQPAR